MELKTAIPEFLSGGGEMGQRIRDYDWRSTPLGPVETWPQSLRTCIRIMLTSRQPIWIGWGKELIKLYNDPYMAILAGAHPSALGKPASVVWKAIWRQIGPMLHTVMEEDQGTYVESQLLLMERNGYPEETYYTFSYTPIPGDDGGTAGMICFNVDDTDRILSERQLQTLTTLAKNLIDCMSYSDAIRRTLGALGKNGRDFPWAVFYSVSGDTAMLTHGTGTSADCVPAMLSLSPPEEGLAGAMLLAQTTHTPQIFDCSLFGFADASMPTGDWDTPPSKAIVLPIYVAGAKEVAGFLVIGLNPFRPADERYISFCSLIADQMTTSFADIHVLELERGRAEALAEIDRAKTLFFSNISHEFRTPLTLLLGPMEDLLNDPSSIENNKYRIGVAYRNALRMQKLVNTLLEFSRIEAGRMEGQYQRVDIVTLTLDLTSTFRSAIEKAGMQLTTTSSKITGDVYVDPELWERIILNLVSNAFKYSHDGTITVDIRQTGEFISVSVSDTGIGIAEDQLDKIFDRFHRVENSGGRSLEGTGIGLAMVRELVKLHQGTISVTSVVGSGSTFTVRIPIGTDHLPAERIAYSPTAATRSRQADAFVLEAMKWIPDEAGTDLVPVLDGMEIGGEVLGEEANDRKRRYRVLLADDNADMREYVERLLAPQFTVLTAKDGQEALELLLTNHPDLLITDVMMPRLDGFGLLREIRESPELMQIPVIMLSARTGEEAKIEGLEAGADDYLVKPFGGRELLARVESNIRIAKERAAALKAYSEKLEQTVRKRTQDLRRLNISLEQSNEDLQQFAHVASHDLKEPVRKIKTFTGRLLDEYGATFSDQARSFLRKIQHATERMGTMIEGVLAYSSLHSDEQPILPVNLNTLFESIESDLEVRIGETGAVIRRGILPEVEGAPVLLYQLFYNLMNNALKFSTNAVNPLIVISSRVTEGAGKRIAEVTMKDNGIGFDQEQSSRIFEAFARLNSKDKFEGTGLGLALCKKIAERHHGSISATAVRGEGAEFVVRLPLIQIERRI